MSEQAVAQNVVNVAHSVGTKMEKQTGNGALTIADIARELGVSKSTVSRVINGKGRIGEETRNRVLSWVKEHNYTPNPIAKGLAQKRTFNAAVLIPKDADKCDIPFFQNCLIGITETLAARGYDSLLAIEDSDDIENLKRLVSNRKVDGVILTRLLEDDAAVKYLKEEGFPFVVIGTSPDDSIYQVDSDQVAGCGEITDILIKKGCSSMIMLGGDQTHLVNRRRAEGYMQSCKRAGIEDVDRQIVWNLNSQEDVDDVLPEVMRATPQCLVCMDDAICARVLLWLKQNDYEVPEDVQVVSFYDSAILENHTPPVTALSVNAMAMSLKAGNLLLDVLDGKICTHRVKVNYELKVRNSTR